MADIWKETFTPRRKGWLPPNAMAKMWEFPAPRSLPNTLSPREVWIVRVCSFTFVFHTLHQVEACLTYYSKKLHPSSRIPSDQLGDHWEHQRWFERVPMYLLE